MTQPAESTALTTAPAQAEEITTTSGAPAAQMPRLHLRDLAKPLGWYVDWVRANPEGASSLTRFSRTFAMLVSEPSDLVQMELCWGAAKVHANVNEAILYTANRRVTLSEGITLLLGATREVECLMELLVRKYKGNAMAWNAMLALEAVKSLLNLCMHRQLFLVPWMWHSMRLYMRRLLRRVGFPVRRRPQRALTDDGHSKAGRSLVGGGSNLVGEVEGPGGVRLVIPRVISNRRQAHAHTYYAEGEDGADAHTPDDQDDEAREELEAVHFAWVDVLGMLVDAYLLVRPVALVWAARRSFAKVPNAESIGKPPVLPSAREWAEQQDKAYKAAVAEAKAKGLPAPKPGKAPPMPSLMDDIMQTPAQRTLGGNWRLWGTVMAADLIVALLSRFIRQRRVPVVYVDVQGNESDCAPSATAVDDEGRPTLPLPRPPAEAGAAADGDEADGAAAVTRAERTEAPAVVSRDSLRLQQATRNVAFNFLRDPFFSATLRQFIYDHFVDGFLNRIPLLGAIVGYQVSYYLSMRHYSFLYTVGQ